MRILWAVPYLPWPTTSGGKTRQYHLLRAMAERGHRVTLLAQSKVPLDQEACEHLERVVERLIVLPRRPLRHPVTCLAALLAPYPLLACVNGFSRGLSKRFSQLLDEPWDVIQVEHSYFLQPFLTELRRRNRGFMLTEHNLESSLGEATFLGLPEWAGPFIRYDRWRYRRWERRVFREAGRIAAVTSEDAAAMSAIRGDEVDVVINGIDTRDASGVQPQWSSRRILFVGNYEYPPNREAVQWVVEEILPLVWRDLPDIRFAVCGFAMPAAWARRWPDPRIEWIGYAPDLAAEQSRSAVFLAALRQGGGSKLKVLEALASGLALVATSQAATGLALRDGVEFLRGDDSPALAGALVRLLGEPELARRIGETGRGFVQSGFDWSVAAGQLEAVYRKLGQVRPGSGLPA